MAEYLFPLFLFLFGTSIGSFLNVCIHRIPAGISLILPSSHCPECEEPIAFYDNIPLISYLILGGRCRKCGVSIPVQYPLVELLSGIFLLLIFERFGWSLESFVYFTFLSALLVIAGIDLKHKIIPDEISLTFLILGLLLSQFIFTISFWESLLGALLGGGILYIIASLYYLFTKVEGMGGGDIKLLAMIGAFLGWKGVLFSLFLGSFSGSIIGLIIISLWGKNMKYALPFGPFLSLGASIYLFFGEKIIEYLHIGIL